MASAGDAGKRIVFQVVHHCQVSGTLKRARAFVAMQTFPIVIRMIEMNRIHRRAEILHVNVVQAVEFHAQAAVHRVIGVAGVAGFVGGDAVILKMRASDIVFVIHIQTLPPRGHDVAGQTETCLLGSLEVFRSAEGSAQNRQHAEAHECEHLSFASYRKRRPYHHHQNHNDGDANQRE